MSINYNELLVDLNDIYGRFIPGLVLLGDTYLLANYDFHSASPTLFYSVVNSVINQLPSVSLIAIILVVIATIIIGELPLFLIFSRKQFFLPKPLSPQYAKWNFLETEDFKKILETDILAKSLTQKASFDDTRRYFKFYLLNNCPEAYTQLNRIEVKLNLYGGMIIPLAIGTVITGLYQVWLICGILALLTWVFYGEFKQSLIGEAQVTLVCYYNHRISAEMMAKSKEDSLPKDIEA